MFDLFEKKWQKDIHKRIIRGNQEENWTAGIVQPHDAALPDSRKVFGGTLIFLYIMLAVVILVILIRLIYLQFFLGEQYKEKALNNHLRTYVTRSIRGVFFDRNQTLLTKNIPQDSAALIPADLPRDSDQREMVLSDISQILALPLYKIEETIKQFQFYYYPVVLKEGIDHTTKLELLAKYPNNQNGVVIMEDFSREYVYEEPLAHILGYLGKISRDEWKASRGNYNLNSEIGRVGLESSYEDILRGRDAEKKVNVDASGRPVDVLATSEAVAGCDLILTIDLDLQLKTHEILTRTLKNTGTEGGVVIVMDPKSGEILSMVSLPDYDNNLFSNGIKGEEVEIFTKLTNSESKPFLHRAISGIYPPGSTFKLVTASAVLEGNVIEVGDNFDAPGTISVPNQFNPDELFIYKDWKSSGHGYINVVRAIAESSDTFFYKVTGGYEGFRGLGHERLKQYAVQFGLGMPLGIDLPGESAGIFPDEAWKVKRLNQTWYVGDTYNLCIGQGYLLTTPLQVAAYTSVIANGGTLYKPHLVKEAINCEHAEKISKFALNQDFISKSHIQAVQQGMRLSVTDKLGTAKVLQDFMVPVASKTGTAQYANNEKEHAWFVVYAPYDDPEIVVTVLVEGGGEGGKVALPVARDVMQYYFSSNLLDSNRDSQLE